MSNYEEAFHMPKQEAYREMQLKQHDFSDLGPSISETTSSLRDYILNPLHSSSLQAELGSAPVPALGIVPARQN
jgi:hypothetical protein